MLVTLLKKYRVISFKEGRDLYSEGLPNTGYLIIRHDIDMDLQAAAAMSLIEKNHGLSTTYFVMLRCPIYNIFSLDGSKSIRAIIENGHAIGLHFDCALYPDVTRINLERFIDNEVSVISSYYGIKIDSVSFHRPGSLELNSLQLTNYIQTYEKVFTEYFSYYSDSRSKWARGNPLDSADFSRTTNLHLLMHPVWWGINEGFPFGRLQAVVAGINNQAEDYLANNCAVWNEGKKSST
jgi:hypothetical protein